MEALKQMPFCFVLFLFVCLLVFDFVCVLIFIFIFYRFDFKNCGESVRKCNIAPKLCTQKQIERERARERAEEQERESSSSTILPTALQQKSTQHTTATTQPPALPETDPCAEGEEWWNVERTRVCETGKDKKTQW